MSDFQEKTILTPAIMVIKTLEDLGYQAEPLTNDLGIDLDAVDESSRTQVKNILSLIASAVKYTQDPAIGIKIGKNILQTNAHSFSFVLWASTSISDFLTKFAKYSEVLTTITEVSYSEDEQYARLTFDLPNNELDDHLPEVHDIMLSATMALCRQAAPRNPKPYRVKTKRKAPEDRTEWEDYFGCIVEFSSPVNELCFVTADISKPLPLKSAQIAEVADKKLHQELESLYSENFKMKIEIEIRKLLSGGRVSQERLADRIGISTRSLQAKLSDHNTTYGELLNETRLELSKNYLRDDRTTMADIATALGFSSAANFSRWFTKNQGISPTGFKSQ